MIQVYFPAFFKFSIAKFIFRFFPRKFHTFPRISYSSVRRKKSAWYMLFFLREFFSTKTHTHWHFGRSTIKVVLHVNFVRVWFRGPELSRKVHESFRLKMNEFLPKKRYIFRKRYNTLLQFGAIYRSYVPFSFQDKDVPGCETSFIYKIQCKITSELYLIIPKHCPKLLFVASSIHIFLQVTRLLSLQPEIKQLLSNYREMGIFLQNSLFCTKICKNVLK